MLQKIIITILCLLSTISISFSNIWNVDQKVLFQFEEMLYNNWEGDGFNYVSGSIRYIGNFNLTSSDSTFKLLNNADMVLGTTYNSTDKWKIQENKISANASANQKLLNDLNFNGTADLKSYFDLTSTYLLGALGVSFIRSNISIQENPMTLRAGFFKNEKPTFEFGNYVKLTWKGSLDTNITMTIKLENFYKYGQIFLKESYWNLDAMCSFQISKIISSHIVLHTLYDINESKKLQAFEKITIGFTWNL